ncbi:MAG: hypothetical protein IPQ13_09780 [Holophagaceae bacterium]|nr:hypothetical protein [Holophagaceae bacterium]
MKIEQKKMSNRHTFTFGQDTINFHYLDKTGSGDADIPYSEFPKKHSIAIEQNQWLKNVGYLWCALGIIQIGYSLYANNTIRGTGFWLMIGLACIVLSRLTKVSYTVYKAESGSVFIIQDGKKHDQIINEIFKRKKQYLLSHYGEIDHDTSLQNEINKFHWLVDEGVLTSEEASQRISEAEVVYYKETPPPMSLN